jgi:hypothetical protein
MGLWQTRLVELLSYILVQRDTLRTTLSYRIQRGVSGSRVEFESGERQKMNGDYFEAGKQSQHSTSTTTSPSMADSDTTKKLIHEAEDALQKASGAVESTITTTKQSLNKVDQTITEEASVAQSALESILGGKKRFWVEKPVDGRRLANNMVGWGLFGCAVHAWHRGIQKKPIWGRRESYFLLIYNFINDSLLI